MCYSLILLYEIHYPIKPFQMKSLIERSQGATDGEQEPCSENKCKTCFENGGCIYEQYAALRDAWKVYVTNEMTSVNAAITQEMRQNSLR